MPGKRNTRRWIQCGLLCALGQATTACAQSNLTLTGTGQGAIDFSSSAIRELSGLTYLGGDSFVVVSDTNGTMAPATITIDLGTGQITAASLGTPISVSGGNDLEAIAYDPRDGSVLIADEAGNTITRHLLADGSQVGSINVPTVFDDARGNRGFESLSLSPSADSLWTANEEALTVDGPLSTVSDGTVVRLQRFDSAGQPAIQHGYLTQPHAGDSSLFGISGQSGVADLIALPGHRLIVMERELGGAIPSLRNRFYLIDASSAIDTTSVAALTASTPGLVEKELLYQVNAGFANYEGVALGPMLENGDYAVLLVSDDGSGGTNPQQLLSLRLSGVAVTGDVNGDFVVDADDLEVVLNGWNTSVATGNRLAGDLDPDGQIGIGDLDVVLANWTDVSTPPTTVPEPGAASLLAGLVTLLGGRW